jgi:hypothetical protein
VILLLYFNEIQPNFTYFPKGGRLGHAALNIGDEEIGSAEPSGFLHGESPLRGVIAGTPPATKGPSASKERLPSRGTAARSSRSLHKRLKDLTKLLKNSVGKKKSWSESLPPWRNCEWVPVKKRRGRRSMGAEERRRVSDRMKSYWASRLKQAK